MGSIVPALLVMSEYELEEKLAKIDGLVTDIQIDAIDGKFASPPTWPYTETPNKFTQSEQQGKILPYCEKFHIEADLMVTDIADTSIEWSTVGASRLVLHAKSIANMESSLTAMERRFGYEKNTAPNIISIGVALTVDDDITFLKSIIHRVNFIQCMGIVHVGLQGEPFDERVLDLVQHIRLNYANIPIQVDGGVSLSTAPALLKAGVNRLIIGSAIWKAPNIAERIHEFKDMVQQYGIYES